MEQKTITLYDFNELSPEAKATALENHRNELVEQPLWFASVEEAAEDRLAALGFESADIYFSGFGNQGDGACFDARIDIEKLAAALGMENELPLISEHAEEFNATIVTLSTRYSHPYTHRLEVEWRAIDGYTLVDSVVRELRAIAESLGEKGEELRVEECTRIYKELEEESENLTSDDILADYLTGNESKFTESGADAVID